MKLTGVVRGIPTLSSTLLKPICCSSSPTTTALKPKIPLFLKPPKYSATLKDLRRWHAWAQDLASSVGSTFTHLDNGPDSALLKRELKWLLEDALEDASQLLAGNGSMDVPLKAHLDELFEMWRERIEERRPFQYLVGCEHWRDLVLCVEEGVLIPRPETELVIDLLKDVVGGELGDDGLWADLGTGSGALAIGIARILGREGRVVATDVSPIAVQVASFNVQRYGLQGKIAVREGSWFEPLKDFEGKLAGLVSNPPYIPSGDIPGLQAEVGHHEPILALDGGGTGMDCLHHLISGVGTMLKSGGFFAFETNGEKQCNFLAHYLSNDYKSSFCDVKIVPDYAGIQRFLTGFHR